MKIEINKNKLIIELSEDEKITIENKAPQVEAEEPRVNYIPCFSNFIPRSSNN